MPILLTSRWVTQTDPLVSQECSFSPHIESEMHHHTVVNPGSNVSLDEAALSGHVADGHSGS